MWLVYDSPSSFVNACVSAMRHGRRITYPTLRFWKNRDLLKPDFFDLHRNVLAGVGAYHEVGQDGVALPGGIADAQPVAGHALATDAAGVPNLVPDRLLLSAHGPVPVAMFDVRSLSACSRSWHLFLLM